MKKLLLTLLIVMSFGGLFAQNFWQDYPFLNQSYKDSSWTRSFITLEGAVNYGCDGINNQFLQKMYTGGYMDSEFVEKSSRVLLPNNRIGISTITGITYGRFVNDSSHEILTLSLLNRNSVSGKFSDDAFHLGFQGNTRFKGEEADFSRTRFTYMNWSQFRVGYITPHPHGQVAFSFSLLAGHHYNQADIEYGKLFTDSNGSSLIGSVAGDYWSSDTANTSLFALNGLGTSVDITWTYSHEAKNSNSYSFKADLLDFGFINWNNKTIHQTVDTSFTWNGVDVSQFFIDPNFVAELPEENDFIKSDTTEFHRSIFLPAVARGTFSRTFFDSQLLGRLALSMPFWSEALPYGALTATWRSLEHNFALGGGIAYGGYARVQVPLKAEIYVVRSMSLDIGTTNALAFFNSASTAGAGAYVKLSYCFK
jgi:hypothetical protein